MGNREGIHSGQSTPVACSLLLQYVDQGQVRKVLYGNYIEGQNHVVPFIDWQQQYNSMLDTEVNETDSLSKQYNLCDPLGSTLTIRAVSRAAYWRSSGCLERFGR
jgi:hypothetical protein